MRKNFSFNKFRIKERKHKLYFFDAFNNDKKNNNIVRFNSFLKIKETKLPILNQSKPKKSKKLFISKLETKYPAQSIIKLEKVCNTDINSNNNNNLVHKKKQKTTIPINKNNQCQNINQNFIININNNNIPINKNNQCQNINQNFIININNNNINNSYQIKMNNNAEMNKNKSGNNNFNFSKMKIINTEENKNVNVSKSNYSEISDLSCFYSNKKTGNLNSINSFVNNDFDIFSISEESDIQNIGEINILPKKSNNNFMKEIKKIYINPVEFEKFCKEINEKLQL